MARAALKFILMEDSSNYNIFNQRYNNLQVKRGGKNESKSNFEKIRFHDQPTYCLPDPWGFRQLRHGPTENCGSAFLC